MREFWLLDKTGTLELVVVMAGWGAASGADTVTMFSVRESDESFVGAAVVKC